MDEYPIILESVLNDTLYDIQRLRVPGGFLVITRHIATNNISTDFIPEPTHKWPLTTS